MQEILIIKKTILILTSSLINWVKFKVNKVQYDGFPRTRGVIILSGFNISIGHNVTINSGKHRNPVGGGIITSIITIGKGKIIIGNNVGMSNVAIVSREEIDIEDNVLLGSGVCIWDNDFHSLNYEMRIGKKEEIIETKPVKICEGAFIGAGTKILKGVRIGHHSIVGAGSVVTKNVPENEIWAGNPARFIRKV